MNTSDKIALGAAIIAGLALVVSILGIYYNRVSAMTSKESARSSAASAKSGEESAIQAKRAADEAARISAIETDRRKEERERWHHELTPQLPAEIIAELRNGTPTDNLFGSITLTAVKNYRVRADAIFGNGGSTPLSLGSVMHPNRPVDLHIEQWPPSRTEPVTREIRFRFWAPFEPDHVDVWDCPCGRPTGESMDDRTPGHWEITVPVTYRRPRARMMGM